nr:hypothetical protein [Tanacetum cinerariifolium]
MLVEVEEGEYVINEGESLQCYEGGEAFQDYGSSGIALSNSFKRLMDPLFGFMSDAVMAYVCGIYLQVFVLEKAAYQIFSRWWMLKTSDSESDKMEGSSVRESRLSEKLDHLPIKKQRFVFREPSQPTFDTPRTESVAP